MKRCPGRGVHLPPWHLPALRAYMILDRMHAELEGTSEYYKRGVCMRGGRAYTCGHGLTISFSPNVKATAARVKKVTVL